MKPVTGSPMRCHVATSYDSIHQCAGLLLCGGTQATEETAHGKAGSVASLCFSEQVCQARGLPFPLEC